MKTLTIIILFFISPLLYGQGKFVTKIYYGKTVQDGWGYLRTWHYVLQVFNDSSVKLDMYIQFDKYMSVQFSKNTFTGTASLHNDTLKISWLTNSFMTVANYQPILKKEEPVIIKGNALLPPNVFVLKSHTALAVGDLLPTMKEISFEELILFEDQFDEWVKINHNKFGKGIR